MIPWWGWVIIILAAWLGVLLTGLIVWAMVREREIAKRMTTELDRQGEHRRSGVIDPPKPYSHSPRA